MLGKSRNLDLHGFEWIGPIIRSFDKKRVNDLSNILNMPTPYRKDNLISTHLIQAIFSDSLFMTNRNHINSTSGEKFKCLSFYSEDQSGIAFTSKEEFGYLVTTSAGFVRQLIKISSQMGTALGRRKNLWAENPRLGNRYATECTIGRKYSSF